MTRTQIREKVRVLLDEYTDQGGWEDAELNHIIDLAHNDVCALFMKFDDSYYLKESDINLTATVEQYSLPSDLIRVKRLVDSDGVPMTRLYKLTERYELLGFGDVKKYYLQGDQIGFLDVPSVSETCKLLYVRKPTAMTADGNSPDCPEHLGHDLIIYKAAIIALTLDEEVNDVLNYKAKDLEEQIIETYYTRNTDFPRQQERDEALDDLDL